jgi:ribosomal protein S18 acetylase RimI-like enzyme
VGSDEGTRLRRYSEDDLPAMVELINDRVVREGDGAFTTLGEMVGQYRNLQRCDPLTDIVVAEDRDGRVIGYARTMWDDVVEGHRNYWLISEADPSVAGLDAELLDWVEQRAVRVAGSHEVDDRRLIGEAVVDGPRAQHYEARGFRPSMYDALMIRPNLDDIPDRPLPAGLELRAVEADHLRAIWEADIEAFRDHRGYVEQTESDWKEFLEEVADQDHSMWQVAWHGDRVVGQVRTFAVAAEIERTGRRRGWTEEISTDRAWRGRGVAAALICSSLRQLAQRGYEEAALGVDTENPHRALGLYESLGYTQVRLSAVYERRIAG